MVSASHFVFSPAANNFFMPVSQIFNHFQNLLWGPSIIPHPIDHGIGRCSAAFQTVLRPEINASVFGNTIFSNLELFFKYGKEFFPALSVHRSPVQIRISWE